MDHLRPDGIYVGSRAADGNREYDNPQEGENQQPTAKEHQDQEGHPERTTADHAPMESSVSSRPRAKTIVQDENLNNESDNTILHGSLMPSSNEDTADNSDMDMDDARDAVDADTYASDEDFGLDQGANVVDRRIAQPGREGDEEDSDAEDERSA